MNCIFTSYFLCIYDFSFKYFNGNAINSKNKITYHLKNHIPPHITNTKKNLIKKSPKISVQPLIFTISHYHSSNTIMNLLILRYQYAEHKATKKNENNIIFTSQ